MASYLLTGLQFVMGLVVSSVIIYLTTKGLGEKEGIGTAILAAIIGSVVYGASYYLIGGHFLASAIGGVGWLMALKGLYKIGWSRAFVIAILVWIIAGVAGFFLPTLTGPL